MTTLSRRIVQKVRAVNAHGLPPEAYGKARLALRDFLSCVFESKDLPQSLQAKAAGHGDLAFVSAVLGHGLVREDMHTASVSHLGIVVFPTLLALARTREVSGREFFSAAICGYEVGAALGRAVMDAETVRVFRPTGITGPVGAALAGALMLGLNEDECVNALGFAANATVGLNEWAQAGSDEMFFHVGFAARNAVTAVDLAAAGAHASETALDGKAGLLAALRRLDRAGDIRPFERDTLEIMEVFHKPAGACNYAQTAIQAASQLGVASSDVKSVRVRCTAAALNYPGCNATGPFGSVLQAKMSIQHGVATALGISPALITLEEDPQLTAAYPAQQGAEVIVVLRDGSEVARRLPDLTPATDADVWARFEQSAGAVAALVAEEDFQGLGACLAKL
jgi:2-methylcitrate dehydratase PrpD